MPSKRKPFRGESTAQKILNALPFGYSISGTNSSQNISFLQGLVTYARQTTANRKKHE